MGLILTRSPFFVSSEGYGTNVQVGLGIDYLVDGVVTNVSYQLEFGTQKEIDVSPLIADYYSKEADILHVEIEVDGSDNLTVFDYLATNGYGYYEDGYNLDLSSALESNGFYAGSNDKVQFYKDGIATIPLLASVNDARTTIKYLKNGAAVNVYLSLQDYKERVLSDGGIYEYSSCLADFLDNSPISGAIPVSEYEEIFANVTQRLNDRIAYFSVDLNGTDADEIQLTRVGSGSIKSLKVETIQECKYTPYKLKFRNRYGVLEDLWFFKRTNESLQVERKDFNRVTFDSYKAGDLSRHSLKQYNVNGKESIELNTGWVCESFYENIKQLMLSEEVYIIKNDVLLPLNITDSDFRYKTHINDKVINYSINAEFAYQKINNIV